MSDSLLGTIAQGWSPGPAINWANQLQTLQSNRFALQQAKLQPAYAGLNALLENPNASWNDVNAALANSAKLGADPSGLVAAAADTAASGGSPADFIKQYGTARYVTPDTAANLFLPQTATVDTGSSVVPVTIGARGGAMPGAVLPASPAIPRTLTPGEATALDNVNIGNGQIMQIPHALAVQTLANNPLLRQLNPSISLTPGAAPQTAPGPYSNQNFGPGTPGDYPARTPGSTGTGAPVTQQPLPTGPTTGTAPPSPGPGPAAPAAWEQPPPPPPSGGQSGGIGVSASPQVLEQQRLQAGTSNTQLAALQQGNALRAQTTALLSDMRAEQATPGFQGGIAAQSASTFRKALQFAGFEDQGNYDTSSPQSSWEAFKKDSSLLGQAQLRALGNSSAITDARQELVEASTPTVDMSDAGRRLLIHTLTGNQTAIQVLNDSWLKAQASGWSPAQFAQWQQTFYAPDKATGGQFDPRVMWMADMTPQEQWEYGQKVAQGSPSDARALMNNLDYAENMGWIARNPSGNFSLGPRV